jgi:L-lactate dehydrogenase complex protein LldG
MTVETGSKLEILRRIREANHASSGEEDARNAWNAVPRNYKRARVHQQEAMLDLLVDRLREYDATVIRSDRDHIAHHVALRLEERGKNRLVIPAGISTGWLPARFEFVLDEGLTSKELDMLGGVLTGSTLAIAETGTIVLQNLPGQGRRAISLIPDYHLCLVCTEDVVETVPEAMKLLQNTATLATTFISGPSATADIEMTRIKGVHGPRTLDVLLFA